MNRRNFFKAVTGFVAGVFTAPRSKAEDKLMCSGGDGLCPRCKFNYPSEEWTYVTASYNGSDGIDIYPKRKQKFHTGDRVHVGDLPENMSHFRGENKDATIIMSYKDEFGGGLHNPPIYSIDIDGFGFNAWYPENLLTKIPNGWKFYINGKEIDSNRAVDKSGCLRWPFKGAKHGDLCVAKSPTISGSWQMRRNKYIT